MVVWDVHGSYPSSIPRPIWMQVQQMLQKGDLIKEIDTRTKQQQEEEEYRKFVQQSEKEQKEKEARQKRKEEKERHPGYP